MRSFLLARTSLIAAAVALCAPALAQQADATGPALGAEADDATHSRAARYVIPMGPAAATTPDGRALEFVSEVVWKPICGDHAREVSVLDLALMSGSHEADFANPDEITIVDSDGVANLVGIDVVFVLGASVPAAAVPAFAAAEAYIQGQFTADPITVTVSVSFASLSPGVIGGTGSSYGYVDWATSRSVLVSGMDATDTIQNSLPSGTTIPVRYSSGSTTNENRVFWTFANWKASGGTVAGNDASMQFSTNFPFDYDPSNGVGGSTISLQDVIVHETCHALGFGSGIDFRLNDIETLDVFRFRSSDGSGDFNPDTTAEFGVRPRWAVYNNPNNAHIFDIISVEYSLSDGSPWQASHFREQFPAIGIMDPAFSYGETFYPNFFRTSDLTVYDAMGYNK